MASFTINIGAEVLPEYTVTANKLYGVTDCDPLTQSLLIGLIKSTNLFNLYYVLQDWTNANAWKTIKLKNIVYSNTTSVYLKHSGAKIPEAGATVYNIDVTGQAVDNPIAGFTIEYDNWTPTQNETIKFDLAMEDVINFTGEYTSVTITFKYVSCPVEEPFEDITVTPFLNNSCWIETHVEVHVPPEGSRYVTSNALDAYSQILVVPTGSLPITITEDTTFQLIIDASTSGSAPWAHTSVVTLLVKESVSSPTTIASHTISRNHDGVIC